MEMDRYITEARSSSGNVNIKQIKKLLMEAWGKLGQAANMADITITAGMKSSQKHAALNNKILDLLEQIANLNKGL
jgi:hypothetical protein